MKTRYFAINKKIMTWLSEILLFFILITLTGCSSSPKQEKLPLYKFIFTATKNVNDSAPLKINIVLLKSNIEFMSADFFSLQANVQTVLGDKLINAEQFFLLPSQHQYFWSEKKIPKASYIGIFAEYKQLNGKKWRIALPVPVPEQPSFYEFWASPPDELMICIQVTDKGLNSIKANKCDTGYAADEGTT
ncbi:outer membrane lipoprotein [Xenorhabdus mauleonii]|uniref:Outer membrane lipoprotein n=1 Tax=Xenorhabdus mauleonii TaxID=351675 RepID=A0A1I3NM65_9GAMM|nr:type VI secretion system lipoprotein TssJ [Xenorhabdus mauleonii]PHM45635.1 outer membrane lipoprotein [Xenorhabdus mauleonii]SFJ10393.1 type VI secretion system protein VasD [Xenorhabdus mauleonii]